MTNKPDHHNAINEAIEALKMSIMLDDESFDDDAQKFCDNALQKLEALKAAVPDRPPIPPIKKEEDAANYCHAMGGWSIKSAKILDEALGAKK